MALVPATSPAAPHASFTFSALPNSAEKTMVEIVGNKIIATINGNKYDVQIDTEQFTTFVTGDSSSREEMKQLVEKVAIFLKTNNLLNHKKDASVQISATGGISLSQEGASIADTGWDKSSIDAITRKYEEILVNPLNSYITHHITENFKKEHFYTHATFGSGKCGPLSIQDQLHQIKKGKPIARLSQDVNDKYNNRERQTVLNYLNGICIAHAEREKIAEQYDKGISSSVNDKMIKKIQKNIQQDIAIGEIPEAHKDEYDTLAKTPPASLTTQQKAKILRYWTAEERDIRSRVLDAVIKDHGKGEIDDKEIQKILNSPIKKTSVHFTEASQFADADVLKILHYRATQYTDAKFWAREDFLAASAYANEKTIVVLAKNEKGIPVIAESFGKSKIFDASLEDIIFIKSDGVFGSKKGGWIKKTRHFESVDRQKKAFLNLMIQRQERAVIDEFSGCVTRPKDKLLDAYSEKSKQLSQRAFTYVQSTLYAHSGEFYAGTGALDINKFHKFATDNFTATKIWSDISNDKTKIKKLTANTIHKIHSTITPSTPTSPILTSPTSTTSSLEKPSTPKPAPTTSSSSSKKKLKHKDRDSRNLEKLEKALAKFKRKSTQNTLDARLKINKYLRRLSDEGRKALESVMNTPTEKCTLPKVFTSSAEKAYQRLFTLNRESFVRAKSALTPQTTYTIPAAAPSWNPSFKPKDLDLPSSGVETVPLSPPPTSSTYSPPPLNSVKQPLSSAPSPFLTSSSPAQPALPQFPSPLLSQPHMPGPDSSQPPTDLTSLVSRLPRSSSTSNLPFLTPPPPPPLPLTSSESFSSIVPPPPSDSFSSFAPPPSSISTSSATASSNTDLTSLVSRLPRSSNTSNLPFLTPPPPPPLPSSDSFSSSESFSSFAPPPSSVSTSSATASSNKGVAFKSSTLPSGQLAFPNSYPYATATPPQLHDQVISTNSSPGTSTPPNLTSSKKANLHSSRTGLEYDLSRLRSKKPLSSVNPHTIATTSSAKTTSKEKLKLPTELDLLLEREKLERASIIYPKKGKSEVNKYFINLSLKNPIMFNKFKTACEKNKLCSAYFTKIEQGGLNPEFTVSSKVKENRKACKKLLTPAVLDGIKANIQ